MVHNKRIAFGVLAGLLLFAGLALFVDLGVGDLQILTFHSEWVWVAFLGYLPCALLRAFRMRYFTRETYGAQGLANMTSVLAVHQAANHIFPMKLGELVYPALMRVMGGHSLARGLGATVLMRFSDLVGLGAVVSMGAWVFADLGATERGVLMVGGVMAIFFGLLGLARSRLLLKLVTPILRPFAPAAVERISEELALSLGAMNRPGFVLGAGAWAAMIAESVLLWMGLVGVHWALGCAFGVCLSPPAMAVGALGSILCHYLPLGTFLNLGTAELGWVATLPLVGVSHKVALVVGAAIHLSLVGITLCCATFGLGWLWRGKNRAKPSGQL